MDVFGEFKNSLIKSNVPNISEKISKYIQKNNHKVKLNYSHSSKQKIETFM